MGMPCSRTRPMSVHRSPGPMKAMSRPGTCMRMGMGMGTGMGMGMGMCMCMAMSRPGTCRGRARDEG